MARRRWWTGLALVLMLAIITAALVLESRRGPTFRPADFTDFADCVANIPAEWRPGSLEHTGATESCGWVHGHPVR